MFNIFLFSYNNLIFSLFEGRKGIHFLQTQNLFLQCTRAVQKVLEFLTHCCNGRATSLRMQLVATIGVSYLLAVIIVLFDISHQNNE
jgi:hypothetical protein